MTTVKRCPETVTVENWERSKRLLKVAQATIDEVHEILKISHSQLFDCLNDLLNLTNDGTLNYD